MNLDSRPRLRTRIWAFLLAFITPGLGQAFNGEYRRGIAFGVVTAVALLAINASVFAWPFWPRPVMDLLALAVVASLVLIVWAAVDGWRRARPAGVPRPGRVKRYLVYAAFILGWQAPDLLFYNAPSWKPYSVPSGSMRPTLEIGDNFFDSDGFFQRNPPQRGDIATFHLPSDPSIIFVKRIIGLPGDRIQLKHGVVYLNDEPLGQERRGDYHDAALPNGADNMYEQYDEILPNGVRHLIINDPAGDQPLDNTEVFSVPPGHYFMLGDNRDNSADSRDPQSGVGYVPEALLVGKATFVYFSTNQRHPIGTVLSWLPSIRWSRVWLSVS